MIAAFVALCLFHGAAYGEAGADSAGGAQAEEQQPTFEIKSYSIEGNTLLPKDTIQGILKEYTGPKKTAETVNKARDALEKYYHDAGYPAVLVNIPEQSIEEQSVVVKLQVIESKIGNVRVTGNRYYTKEKIIRELPSLAPGKVLYVPSLQRDLERINRGEDLKATPSLSPGQEMGTTDVEIKVEDKLPFHGSFELNNRSTHDTSPLRINAMLRYDNLWQMDHSLALQGQLSPRTRARSGSTGFPMSFRTHGSPIIRLPST